MMGEGLAARRSFIVSAGRLVEVDVFDDIEERAVGNYMGSVAVFLTSAPQGFYPPLMPYIGRSLDGLPFETDPIVLMSMWESGELSEAITFTPSSSVDGRMDLQIRNCSCCPWEFSRKGAKVND